VNTYQSSRALFRVLAIVLGAFFLGIGSWKLIARPVDWLNLATSLVVIVIGMQFVHAGITDRWGTGARGARDAMRGSIRHRFMTVEPTETESTVGPGEPAADQKTGPSLSSAPSTNPYDPPRTVSDPKHGLPAELFLAGQPFIHYGVVFFVDPADTTAMHAALPLPKVSAELVGRNVEEATRVLPQFLSSVPTLRSQLLGRQLVIRMIASYDDLSHEVSERVIRSLVIE
jgi:hypothetical protein